MRIVSLLPSATEIVCQLGLECDLVGVSHECDYPPTVQSLPKVTRSLIPHAAPSRDIDTLVRERLKTEQALYSLDLSILTDLRPDLIVTQALCDVCAVAESEVRAAACALPGQPQIVSLEPTCLDDVFQGMRRVAAAADCTPFADRAIKQLRDRIATVAGRTARIDIRPRTILLEWIDPPFSCGHWNPELVELAGGREMIGIAGTRSRTITWQNIIAAQPEVLVIACCGFDVSRACDDLPRLQAQPDWHDLPCVRAQRVYLIDGSAHFNRPGPRLIDSLEILAHALHPAIHPLPTNLPAAQRIAAARV
jgi:iron complex transport system substrate-binding protein